MSAQPYILLRDEQFELFDPNPDLIDYDEMVSTLAKICRYNGRCSDFYSVAQHSVHCAELCGSLLPDEPLAAMACLLHDAAEYLMGDVVTSLKRVTYYRNDVDLVLFEQAEAIVGKCISEKLGWPVWHEIVPTVDKAMLYRELLDLTDIDPRTRQVPHGDLALALPRIQPQPWQRAEQEFHQKYAQLASCLTSPPEHHQ